MAFSSISFHAFNIFSEAEKKVLISYLRNSHSFNYGPIYLLAIPTSKNGVMHWISSPKVMLQSYLSKDIRMCPYLEIGSVQIVGYINMRPIWSRWTHNPVWLVSLEEIQGHRHIKAELHLTTEAESKVPQLQARKCQGLLIHHQEARKNYGRIPLPRFRAIMALPTPWY